MTRLQEALSGHEDPVYAERRQAAFPFRDGGCCERVSTAIERLLDRRPALSPLHASEQARSDHGRLARPADPSRSAPLGGGAKRQA